VQTWLAWRADRKTRRAAVRLVAAELALIAEAWRGLDFTMTYATPALRSFSLKALEEHRQTLARELSPGDWRDLESAERAHAEAWARSFALEAALEAQPDDPAPIGEERVRQAVDSVARAVDRFDITAQRLAAPVTGPRVRLARRRERSQRALESGEPTP